MTARQIQRFLPTWSRWTLAIGLCLSILILVSGVSRADVELVLIVASTCLFAPMFRLLAGRFPLPKPVGRITELLGRFVSTHALLLAVLASSLLTLSIFGASIRTNWSIIDDHEIMLFIGPGHPLTLPQMLSDLHRTEIGQYGTFERFRPTYWFLRLLECVLWGADPYAWHAFRVLILFFGLSLSWCIILPRLGWLTSGLLCAYALTFLYWWQLIGFLGPGETYAVAALPLYVWGAARLLQEYASASARRRAGLAVLVGSVVCIGSKENFVLLALPTLYLAMRALRRRDLLTLALTAGSVLFAVYVALGVILATAHSNLDIYSRSIAPIDRFAAIARALEDPGISAPLISLIVVTLGAALLWLVPGVAYEAKSAARVATLWLGGLCFIYLSQMYFYDGNWPTGSRYDFPGLLYIPAAIFILYRLAVDLVADGQRTSASAAFRAGLAFSLSLLVAGKGYSSITQHLQYYAATDEAFVSGLSRTVTTLQASQDSALVVETASVLDYEKVFSYLRFSRAYGVRNQIFLLVSPAIYETSSSYRDPDIIRDMLEVSATGRPGPGALDNTKQLAVIPYQGYSPIAQLQGFNGKCLEVVLSGSPSANCQNAP